MSFGSQPIANGFLKEHEFSEEYFFEMETAFCESCNTFQLVTQPSAEKMFHENYAFFRVYRKTCAYILKCLLRWSWKNILSTELIPSS